MQQEQMRARSINPAIEAVKDAKSITAVIQAVDFYTNRQKDAQKVLNELDRMIDYCQKSKGETLEKLDRLIDYCQKRKADFQNVSTPVPKHVGRGRQKGSMVITPDKLQELVAQEVKRHLAPEHHAVEATQPSKGKRGKRIA